MNLGMLNSAGTSSGPSIGASSLVTDANSALCSGPQLQRSASINNESYMRLPPSPMSFSSNNIVGSPVMEGSSILQQSPHQEGLNKLGASAAASETMARETVNSLNAQKKMRTNLRQEDFLQQQVIQEHLQRRESMPSGQQNLQLQAVLQQQRLAQLVQQQQQQQLLQSLNQMPRTPLSLQQQQQLRQQLQQQAVQLGTPVKHPLVSGICSRRLMQYLYHQRQRPQDNNMSYWRKFVSEYFAPQAKKRICLSVHDNIANQAPGSNRQPPKDAWHCNLCGSKSGKGFEVTVEAVPRLCKVKFDGVIDENLFLDMPNETRLPSGLLMLEYAKATEESVYEQLRVVHEGQLRIIFTEELKILSWEFCLRRHEDLFPRRMLLSQANQLLQAAQKYQNTIGESGISGLPHQNLLATCNTFLTSSRQLAKCLESQSMNDFGFSKRYDRCLQIYEVVNSMKSLMDFTQDQKTGPIESLKNYSRLVSVELQKRKLLESEHLMSQILPANTLTKNTVTYQGSSRQSNLATSGAYGSNRQNVLLLNNYQTVTVCPNQNDLQQEASNVNGPKQALPSQFHSSTSVLTTPNNILYQQQQQSPSNACLAQHNNSQPSQGNQYMQQNTVQQMLQHTANTMGVQQHQNNNVPNSSGTLAAGDTAGVGSSDATASRVDPQSSNKGTDVRNTSTTLPDNSVEKIPSGSNTSRSAVSNPGICGRSLGSSPDSPLDMDIPALGKLAEDFIDDGWFKDCDGWWADKP